MTIFGIHAVKHVSTGRSMSRDLWEYKQISTFERVSEIMSYVMMVYRPIYIYVTIRFFFSRLDTVFGRPNESPGRKEGCVTQQQNIIIMLTLVLTYQ